MLKPSTLVTGAAGFVGYHTSMELRRRSVRVVGLDNFNPYYGDGLKRARARLLRQHGVRVVEGDVCNSALLSRLMRSADHVIHLAAQAGVRHSLTHPYEYIQSNVKCFVKLVEAVRRQNASIPIVYASSSSVYGLNRHIPFTETDRVERQASLYGATKESNERIAHVYHHLHGLRMTGLRFFTVYGPYGRPDMAYYGFSKAILKGNVITEYRLPDGTELQRDFTYIDDIVQGVLAASRRNSSLRVYNLGNRRPQKVSTLIRALEREWGCNATRIYRSIAAGDVPITFANTTLAEKELGYAPSTGLDDGIRIFVQWYRHYYDLKQHSHCTS